MKALCRCDCEEVDEKVPCFSTLNRSQTKSSNWCTVQGIALTVVMGYEVLVLPVPGKLWPFLPERRQFYGHESQDTMPVPVRYVFVVKPCSIQCVSVVILEYQCVFFSFEDWGCLFNVIYGGICNFDDYVAVGVSWLLVAKYFSMSYLS